MTACDNPKPAGGIDGLVWAPQTSLLLHTVVQSNSFRSASLCELVVFVEPSIEGVLRVRLLGNPPGGLRASAGANANMDHQPPQLTDTQPLPKLRTITVSTFW